MSSPITPNGWTHTPLGEMAEVDRTSLPSGTSPSYSFYYLDISSISGGRMLLPAEKIKYIDAPSRARRVLQKGDVMMATVRPSLKAFCCFDLDREDYICSTGFAVLTPIHGNDSRFILYCLLSNNLERQIESHVVGSNYPAINSRDVKRLYVLHPEPQEQRKIGKVISTIDGLIEKTETLIAKYSAMKQGIMHDLFTRGVDRHDRLRMPREQAPELYKESELGWIPREWDARQLQEVAEVSRGKFTARPRNDPRYYGGEYEFIQTGDVASCEGSTLHDASQSLNDLGLKVSKLFPVQTIAVTIAANIADTAILGRPMCFPDSLVGVEVKHPNSVRYIELCIRRNKERLNAMAPQSAQKNINLTDLRPMLIPVADVDEQVRIASRYESAVGQLSSLRLELLKYRELKQGLMQDLLTGKVRVTPDPEDLPVQAGA